MVDRCIAYDGTNINIVKQEIAAVTTTSKTKKKYVSKLYYYVTIQTQNRFSTMDSNCQQMNEQAPDIAQKDLSQKIL